ncbi:MAG TPA: phosphopantetheine-binding protein, partial [Polyangia bacterium]
PAERFLANLWSDLIGSKVSNIGTNDNFFDVCGHSLLALQAISRIQARTQVRLEARMMFLSSLGQIAEMLTTADQSGAFAEPPAAPSGGA